MLSMWGLPGERRRHHRGRGYGCRGRGLLALKRVSDNWHVVNWHEVLHRLKLVTGVDISTRPVRSTGNEGKAKNKMSLRAAAELNRIAFRRSMTMFNTLECNSHIHSLVDLHNTQHYRAPRNAKAAAPRFRVSPRQQKYTLAVLYYDPRHNSHEYYSHDCLNLSHLPSPSSIAVQVASYFEAVGPKAKESRHIVKAAIWLFSEEPLQRLSHWNETS